MTNFLLSVLRGLEALFVENNALALGILAVVAAAAIVATLLRNATWASGLILVVGSLGVLLMSVVKARCR